MMRATKSDAPPGAILSRLESEFLNPLIDRCFALMYRAKSFGEAPQVATDGSEGEWLNIDVVPGAAQARVVHAAVNRIPMFGGGAGARLRNS